ncbi:MAG: acyl carrier protein [Myxococcota bacterium]
MTQPTERDTWTELRRLARERLGSTAAIDADTDLVADLALDSIQQLDLVVELENLFEIELEPDGEREIRTAGELVAWIDDTRRAGGRP